MKKANWILYSDGKIVDKKLGIEVEFTDNRIIYQEEDILNIVDLEKKTYLRESSEFKFYIDFTNKTFSYLLKENNYKLENTLECNINIDNIITLEYKIDNEIKKILIQIL